MKENHDLKISHFVYSHSNHSPLAAIICGFERGGTTLISEILRQHPGLDSGFEGGFLLGEKPSDFLSIQPYCNMLKISWGINHHEMNYICQAENWLEVYKRLIEKARNIKEKNIQIFDKTPKYMKHLSTVLSRVKDVPCIVIVRDPRAVLWSQAKRSKYKSKDKIDKWRQKDMIAQCNHYLSYANGWKTAIEDGLSSRILLIQYESLCQNPIEETHKIFKFIGCEFDSAYLSLKSKKCQNVYDKKVSAKYVNEYKFHFSEEICQEILEKTKAFKAWFWEERGEDKIMTSDTISSFAIQGTTPDLQAYQENMARWKIQLDRIKKQLEK